MTSLLQPAKVSADSKAYRLQIDPDARLAAAAGGVAKFVAESAEMPSEMAVALQRAVVTVCVEAFESLGAERPHLMVTVERFPDRIEVAVEHQGGPPPAFGLDRLAGFGAQAGGGPALDGVDRVQYESHSGSAITRLIKYAA